MENKGCFTPTLRYATAFFLACLLAAILFPLFTRQGGSKYFNCQSNLKQIALGVFQYTQDYDERFPPVNLHNAAIDDRHPLGWADALQPYLKSTQLYQCYEEKDYALNKKPNDWGYTDYWYNARLDAQKQEAVGLAASTIMFGDGNDGTNATNARYSLKELPAAWHSDAHSPARHHREGANYAFADGHVKWFKPEAITTKKPAGHVATFVVR